MPDFGLTDGFALRRYTPRDRDWVTAAHIAHYRTVERFDQSFDAAVASALADIDSRIGVDRTFGLVLQNPEGKPFGSIFACDMTSCARLRLFLLDQGLHGRGFGRIMLTAVVAAVKQAGMLQIAVSTFDAHTAACDLYTGFGFVTQASIPCSAFGRQMVQIDFTFDVVLP